jgi:RNA polymerase sigma factor (TIGR02999 family)
VKPADALLPLVYEELCALARSRMAREPAGHTLQATALVHEAYLRLVGDEPRSSRWRSRAQFFAAAALAMRRILVERARARRGLRHGGALRRIELDESAVLADEPAAETLALDAALERLEAIEPRKAGIVMLRYFAGLSIEDTAATLALSEATVKTDWAFARAWLHRELSRER